MNSGKQIHLRLQRTNLVNCSAIRSLMILQDHFPNRLLLVLVNSIRKNRKRFLVILKSLYQSLTESGDVGISFLLLIGKYRLFHLFRTDHAFHFLENSLRNGGRLIAVLLFSALCDDALEEADNLLIRLMSKINCLNHLFFRKLIRTGFNHDDLLFCRSNREEQVGNRLLSISRVQNKLPGNHAHLRRCTGAVKGYIGDCCCKRRAKHRKKFRRSILVHG